MPKTIISEGKTTNEAIENGLKELNVTKNDVEIKILENTEKRSFFSILAPRVVKVEMTVKEKNISNKDKENKEKIIYNIEERRKKIEIFLEEFIKKLKNKEINYSIDIINNKLKVEFYGEYATKLIVVCNAIISFPSISILQ